MMMSTNTEAALGGCRARRALGYGAALCALASAGMAQAQEAVPAPTAPREAPSGDSAILEEIVVTATKRAQNAQDVPISISAYSGEQLRVLGVQTTADLALVSPGLQLSSPGGEGNTGAITLRGVGQNDFNDHQEGPVAVYTDEVYSSSLGHTVFQVFDLERVEVLRGPQGTLFGRNATGGLVHFITKRPTRELEGYVDLRYGRVKEDFNEFRVEGAVGGPLADNVQARVSVAAHQRQPFFENLEPNGNGGSDRGDYAGRLQVAFQPSEALDVLVTIRGSESDTNGARSRQLPTFPGVDGLATPVPANVDIFGTGPGNDPAGYRNSEPDFWSGRFDRNGNLDKTQWGATARIEYDIGAVDLVSITDFTKFTGTFQEDVDQGPRPGLGFEKNSTIEQFSQELRLQYSSDRINAVLGGYYLDISGNFDAQYLLYPSYTAALGIGPNGLGSRVEWLQNTKSYSGFGQVDIELVDTLTVVAGARWTQDKKTLPLNSLLYPTVATTRTALNASDADAIDILDFQGRRSDEFWSWKAGVNWEPTRDILVFGSITRGQKAGGFNTPALAGPALAPFLSYRPETLTSYEGGLKLSGDGVLRRFNASVYHYDYKDYQAYQFQNLAALVFNADAKVTGADLELLLAPARGLTLQLGSAILFEATAKDVGLASGRVVDQRLPLTPDFTLSGIARYEWSLGRGRASVQVDGRYQTSQNFAVLNAPATQEGGYAVFNARAGYDLPGGVSISVFVENLANEKYRSFVFDTGLGVAEQFLGAPRTIGVSLAYRFD